MRGGDEGGRCILRGQLQGVKMAAAAHCDGTLTLVEMVSTLWNLFCFDIIFKLVTWTEWMSYGNIGHVMISC